MRNRFTVLKLTVVVYKKGENHEDCIMKTTKVSKQVQERVTFAANYKLASWELNWNLQIKESVPVENKTFIFNLLLRADCYGFKSQERTFLNVSLDKAKLIIYEFCLILGKLQSYRRSFLISTEFQESAYIFLKGLLLICHVYEVFNVENLKLGWLIAPKLDCLLIW